MSDTGGPTNRAYIALYASEKKKGQVQVLFQPRAVEVTGQDQLHSLAKSAGYKAEIKGNGTAEIWLNAADPSDAQREMLTKLGQVIVAGWQSKVQAITPTEPAEIG